MKVTSAEFVRGVTDDKNLIDDQFPQIAFIGRSNVGKSSIINSLTGKKELARSSATPGRTQEINFFLIDNSFYLVDLPGYGYVKSSPTVRELIKERLEWYLFHPNIQHGAIVLIIDSKVGVTDYDMHVLKLLEQAGKKIIIVANKVDKLRSNTLRNNLKEIQKTVGPHMLIPYSSEKHIGQGELSNAIYSVL